jgi:tRNA-dihydrouridine synthase A
MMDHTDRHCRYFLRLISRHVLLYSEMITTGAIIHGDPDTHLAYSPREHPLALQIGGSDPAELARCARIAEDMGYDEVNFNVGCPSNRVQSGRFGACLMAEPGRVADCVAAMASEVGIPVTVKTRTGIDDRDSHDELVTFIDRVRKAGCSTFIIHARKAWLNGLSPKQNLLIPPLQYDSVYQLKKDFPDLEIIINGGFSTLDQIKAQYDRVDGVMIGRAAYHNPYLLAEVDRKIFLDNHPVPRRHEILEEFTDYIRQTMGQGVHLNRMTRHILGLFQGEPGARFFRRTLSEHARSPDAGIEIFKEVMARISAG